MKRSYTLIIVSFMTFMRQPWWSKNQIRELRNIKAIATIFCCVAIVENTRTFHALEYYSTQHSTHVEDSLRLRLKTIEWTDMLKFSIGKPYFLIVLHVSTSGVYMTLYDRFLHSEFGSTSSVAFLNCKDFAIDDSCENWIKMENSYSTK
jgi:hypothetical protein